MRSARGSDYAALSRQVRSAGLLARRPGAYVVHIGVTFAFYLASCAAVVWLGDSWYQLIAAAVLGVAFTQVAFLAHDGGHQQIFAQRRTNDRYGQAAGLLTGLSYGWWLGKHNRHHANPNKEDHDPDIGDGVLAFTTGQVAARTGLGRAITRRQAWLFFPLLTLEGLNLHAASVQSLLPGADRSGRGGHRGSEIALLVVHFVVYVAGLLAVMSPGKALVFAVIHQGVFGLYMGCSFAPNHKGMPTIAADEDVDYLRRQVLTSRNVRGGILTDLALGGLNYQIEHHLFPNMPRPSLHRAQHLVRTYCEQRQISYTETSLLGSYTAALTHLHQLGAPLRNPAARTSDRARASDVGARSHHPQRAPADVPARTGESTHIRDHVIATHLNRAITAAHPCALADVVLSLDGDEFLAASVHVVGAYGADLHELGEQVRGTATRVVTELLGPHNPPLIIEQVDVRVSDITAGDPRRT